MSKDKNQITVFYDGACPTCVRDRFHYEKLAGNEGKNLHWIEINDDHMPHEEIMMPIRTLLSGSGFKPIFNFQMSMRHLPGLVRAVL